MYCAKCGKETTEGSTFCPSCGAGSPVQKPSDQKDYMVALLLSIFLGQLGVDRFYMGYIGLGVLKLLTGGGCGIWWLVDVIMIATNSLKDAQGRELYKK